MKPGRPPSADSTGFDRDVAKLWAQVAPGPDRGDAEGVIGIFGMTPGAGVTTLALAFARHNARQAKSVVLVDANVAHPAIHHALGVELAPGVAELVGAPEKAQEFIRSLEDGRLAVLPGGKWPHPHATTPPGRWSDLLARIRDRGKLVLVDAGVESSPNMAGIAAACDGTMLVVEAGRSRWEQIAAATDRVKSLDVPFLGVVVNKRRFPIPGFIYRRL